MRQKAEELYFAAEKYDALIFAHFQGALPLIKGEITLDEYHEAALKVFEDGRSDSHLTARMLAGLSDAQRRAYVLADNKLALNAGWDDTMLAAEVVDLKAM